MATVNLFHDLPVGDDPPVLLNMVVEITKGSINKFEYDKNFGAIRLDRVIYERVEYPLEYGFIPQTWFDDNDPLDVMCFVTFPTFPGCIMRVRTIGIAEVIDSGEIDDKLIAVAADDPRLNHIKSLKDISDHEKKEIEFFIKHYKMLQQKKVEFKAWHGKDVANRAIKRAMKLYQEKFSAN